MTHVTLNFIYILISTMATDTPTPTQDHDFLKPILNHYSNPNVNKYN